MFKIILENGLKMSLNKPEYFPVALDVFIDLKPVFS